MPISPFNGPRSRWLSVTVATLALGASLTACGSDGGGSADASGKTIYMVPGLTTHPAYRTMYCGAQEEAKKLGLKNDYQGATTWDPSLQIPVVQSLLAKGPGALLLTPTDGSALEPVVKQYASAHIPVVALDTTLNDRRV
jgi:ribose transport system substrate-binding protein